MFIAEIGINHNGDLNIAKELIRVSKECEVDVVKFQKRNVETCVPQSERGIMRTTPWGEMTYLKYKHRIEFDKAQYDAIDFYCNQLNIKWTASVWDIESFNFINNNYKVPFIKIPSACITDLKLLRHINLNFEDPIIMSIGMSSMKEIATAIDMLKDKDLTVLICNSSYPSVDYEIDLNTMKIIKDIFNVKVGYSGHEKDILPTLMAKTLGAEVIERHVTLDRNMFGTDQKSSLSPIELKNLIVELKRVDVILGNEEICVYETEKKAMKKLRLS